MPDFANIRNHQAKLEHASVMQDTLKLRSQLQETQGVIPQILRDLPQGSGVDLQRLNPASSSASPDQPLLASLESVLQVAEQVSRLADDAAPAPTAALPDRDGLLTQLQAVHENADRALGYFHRLEKGNADQQKVHHKLEAHHFPQQLATVEQASRALIGKLQEQVGDEYQKLRNDLMDIRGESADAAAAASTEETAASPRRPAALAAASDSRSAAVDVMERYFKRRPEGGKSGGVVGGGPG